MRCVICRHTFDFNAGQRAVVLRHVAYGFDLAHPGACERLALELLFPEPGYDCAAFAHDVERRAVISLLGSPAFALIEYGDGSHILECLYRDAELRDEPGGAEFSGEGAYVEILAA
jgi:hypothetical protein